LIVPLYVVSPPLASWLSAGTAKLAVLGNGYAIEWVDLDEHIGLRVVGRQTQ
jgi:hypothetical protein